MCDCHSSIQQQLEARFKEMQPTAEGHRISLQGYGFAVINNEMVMRPYMPYKAGADYPLKKGGTKWKSITGNMVFSYCPFCGEKFAQASSASGSPLREGARPDAKDGAA